MSELTKDFEKYYPLPWQGKCRLACYDMGFCEEFIMLDMNAVEGQDGKRAPSLIDFTARGSYDHLNGRDPILEARKDALKYLVLCANLMPEAVALLDDARDVMKWTCEICDGEASGRCGGCSVRGISSCIKSLLAKLEGGAEE